MLSSLPNLATNWSNASCVLKKKSTSVPGKGWGGQKLVESSYGKLERLARLLPDGMPIEVDGGIDPNTAPRCAEAGADVFVAGSAVYGAEDAAAAIERLRELAGAVHAH